MGKTKTFTHRVEFDRDSGVSNMSWNTREYGRPGLDTLKAFIEKLQESTMPGGANEHLTRLSIKAARIVRQSTGEAVAYYQTEPFYVGW